MRIGRGMYKALWEFGNITNRAWEFGEEEQEYSIRICYKTDLKGQREQQEKGKREEKEKQRKKREKGKKEIFLYTFVQIFTSSVIQSFIPDSSKQNSSWYPSLCHQQIWYIFQLSHYSHCMGLIYLHICVSY